MVISECIVCQIVTMLGIIDRGGTISAEHDAKIKDMATMETIKQLKQVLDSRGILNPGKILT